VNRHYRLFEYLAEVSVAARYCELLCIVFLTSVLFWQQSVADAQMLELNLEEYCTDEKRVGTQCWATNAT
jgi:hypothetical protein